MRELQKDVEINSEYYRLHKFSALDGGVLCMMLMEKLLPVWNTLEKEAKKQEEDSKALIGLLGDLFKSITPQELKDTMTTCLNACEKKLNSGWVRVMDGKQFNIQELEHDTMTCMQLCMQCIVFNFGDFFIEGVSNLKVPGQTTSRRTL